MNLNKTRTWNRQTPMNGDLINAEVDRIYSNFTELDETVSDLETEDANLQTQVGNLNSIASKILSKFSVGEVKDLVKSLNYLLAIVDEQDGDLQSQIDAEVTARTNADSSETTARSNADNALSSAIDAEVTARANADSAESTARIDADNLLASDLATVNQNKRVVNHSAPGNTLGLKWSVDGKPLNSPAKSRHEN